MSALTTTLAGLLSANSATSATNTTKKPTELWLNIVFVVGTDAEGKLIEVSLPYGLDLTNMPSRKVGNADSDFNKLLANQNALLEQLRAQAVDLADGDRVSVSAAKVELYKELKKGANEPTIAANFNFGLIK